MGSNHFGVLCVFPYIGIIFLSLFILTKQKNRIYRPVGTLSRMTLNKHNRRLSRLENLLPNVSRYFLNLSPERLVAVILAAGQIHSSIPKDYPLTKLQKIQVKTETTGEVYLDKKAIKEFSNRLQYPLYFLDFETFSSPIPLIDNSSPYQAIPFQFSLHVIEKHLTKEPKHLSWIWNTEGDPRLELLERLQSLLGNKGNILAYHSPFEMMIIKQAVTTFPKYQKWLGKILERFVDLLQPFRAFHIYHPAQKGSCSLKDVLPTLTGQDYSSLEIQDGNEASQQFMNILNGEVTDKQAILDNLEEYCGQDTMAMLEILRKMKELSAELSI